MTARDPHEPDPRQLEAIRRVLDAGLDDLDAATRSRLTRARHAALTAASARPRRTLLPLAAGLAAAVLAVAVIPRGDPLPAPPPAVPAAPAWLDAEAPLELVADGDTLELVEDLEFYAWLEAQEG